MHFYVDILTSRLGKPQVVPDVCPCFVHCREVHLRRVGVAGPVDGSARKQTKRLVDKVLESKEVGSAIEHKIAAKRHVANPRDVELQRP